MSRACCLFSLAVILAMGALSHANAASSAWCHAKFEACANRCHGGPGGAGTACLATCYNMETNCKLGNSNNNAAKLPSDGAGGKTTGRKPPTSAGGSSKSAQ